MKTTVADYRTRVICLRIVARSPGLWSTITLTHFPCDLTMSNGAVYLSGTGQEFTGYVAASSLAPAMIDLSGLCTDRFNPGIHADELARGHFDGARCYLFATSWQNPVEDEEPIVASMLGKTTLSDGRYQIEEMALVDALNQTVGKTYIAACQKKFGGQEYAGCMIDLAQLAVSGTITEVFSATEFAANINPGPSDYLTGGTVRFWGANYYEYPIEISRDAGFGHFYVFEPPPFPVVVGDDVDIVPGCRKRLSDCRDKWNNVVNFGGFPNVPTANQYLKIGSGQ